MPDNGLIGGLFSKSPPFFIYNSVVLWLVAGLFEKLWQFSADLVKKGFKIIEVGNDEKFLEGQISLCEPIPDKYILRANTKGKPQYTTFDIDGITYKAICVENRCYVPDRTITA